jgi:hypothetical protein
MYAVLFGCKHFHQYVYGHEITVQTDHKPLTSIMEKSIHVAPARLQRMILQLQRYSRKLVHVPGKKIPLADTLSRKFLPDMHDDMSKDMEAQIHMVMKTLEISDHSLEAIREQISTDSQLVMLSKVILSGWPSSRTECPLSIQV